MSTASNDLSIKIGDAITADWLKALKSELHERSRLDARSQASIQFMQSLVNKRIALTFKTGSDAFVMLNRCHMADCDGNTEPPE